MQVKWCPRHCFQPLYFLFFLEYSRVVTHKWFSWRAVSIDPQVIRLDHAHSLALPHPLRTSSLESQGRSRPHNLLTVGLTVKYIAAWVSHTNPPRSSLCFLLGWPSIALTFQGSIIKLPMRTESVEICECSACPRCQTDGKKKEKWLHLALGASSECLALTEHSVFIVSV